MRKSAKFSPEAVQRAVRMRFDAKGQHPSQWAAIESIAGKIGCTAETLRLWVRQGERNSGAREGPTTAEQPRVKELEREIERVWENNMRVYGADKLWNQLRRERFAVARCTLHGGAVDARSSWPRSNGSRGSTTIDSLSPSATSRPPKPRQTTGDDNKARSLQPNIARPQQRRELNHDYMAQPGDLRRPLRTAGKKEDRTAKHPNSADHAGLTHTNWPPRQPGWFKQLRRLRDPILFP